MKSEVHKVTYKSEGMYTKVEYILYERCNIKGAEDCKVVSGEDKCLC